MFYMQGWLLDSWWLKIETSTDKYKVIIKKKMKRLKNEERSRFLKKRIVFLKIVNIIKGKERV